MLHTTIVPVNRQPVFESLFAGKCFIICWVNITQEVPRRTSPLRHCICLTLCFSATAWTSCLNPGTDFGDWRFPVIRWFIVVYLRQTKRKFFFRNRYITTFFTFYNRNRLTPVTLSGKYPVTQFEVFLCRSHFLIL